MRRTGTVTRSPGGGFTLVEMLVVVVILGILSTIATVGYRRYVARARTSEAVAMLAEMMSREQIYFTEFAVYVPLRRDNAAATAAGATATEPAAQFYPIDPSTASFDSVRAPTSIANTTLWPTSWNTVGLRPKDRVLYCTYFLGAGLKGSRPPAAAAEFGGRLLGSPAGALNFPWFYALGACNLKSPGGYPSQVTVLGMSSQSPTLVTFNDGQ